MFNTEFPIIENMLFNEILNTIKALSRSEIEGLIEKCSDDKGEPLYCEAYSGQPVEEQLADFVVKHNDSFDNQKIKEVLDNFDYAKAGETAKLDLREIAAGYDEYMWETEKAKREYMERYGVSENVIDYDER